VDLKADDVGIGRANVRPAGVLDEPGEVLRDLRFVRPGGSLIRGEGGDEDGR
jgi:hypothetical protein